MVREKILNYISDWERKCYTDGLPDEVPVQIYDKAPSYKKIAMCILLNDFKPLGIHGKKSKYYSILKKIEIEKRNH